jgi:hypothetical protein
MSIKNSNDSIGNRTRNMGEAGKGKVKQCRYRPGVAERVLGS